jgi:hypothetical protein
VLLFQRHGLTGLPAKRLYLLLGVSQRFFGGKNHVVSPFFQLLTRQLEMDAVLLERPTNGGVGSGDAWCANKFPQYYYVTILLICQVISTRRDLVTQICCVIGFSLLTVTIG